MAYATPAELVIELGRPANSEAETAQWQSWLDRLERDIVRRFERAGLDFSAQVDLGSPSVQDVIDVEVAVVARRVATATMVGLSSVTRSIDDASITERRESDSSVEALEPTDAEWDVLIPGGSLDVPRVFSVTPL